MSAERLRQAADRLDALVADAEPGRWESFWEGRDHLGGDSMINTTSSNIYIHADPRPADFGVGTQDYIAAMHPHQFGAMAGLYEADGDDLPGYMLPALAVADAILGGAA